MTPIWWRHTERVRAELERFNDGTGLVDLRWGNGMSQFHISGLRNHKSVEGQEVIDSFYRIGEVAPGSYGMMYMRDDEDPDGRRNEFQILVLRRGQVTQEADRLLSPCTPVIEDEEE